LGIRESVQPPQSRFSGRPSQLEANRSEGRLARDDVFAEKQAANHHHYHDGATHVTKAEADWMIQKALHY
jgi:hypothetical protein